ncbi:MAG: LPS export ABC transporter permease LptG [Hyphomicrobiales bacterium]|nr:LPS export ABC transporter permease LptG [Hyphomicrobiales bacterium]
MISQTLGIYFALRFGKIMLGMLAALLFLIVTVDFIEQLRKVSEKSDISVGMIYLVSMLRAPIFLEKAFPFGCLFAAMITLTQLNQRMELVVARAAGVSVWQFLLPLSICAALIGVLATTIYNPLAITAINKANEISAEIFKGKKARQNVNKKNVWIRQEVDGRSAVINATYSRKGGTVLQGVRIIEFDREGFVAQRIEAELAEYRGDYWELSDVSQSTGESVIRKIHSLKFRTNLSADSILGSVSDPETINFWDLRSTAAKVRNFGINPGPYLVRYHSLTALPLFLVSMVLIAATVSLRFVRFGQSGRMILGGILSGFVLYIVSNLVISLGSNGVVPPIAAAWAPSVVAILFGMSILLHQEDG